MGKGQDRHRAIDEHRATFCSYWESQLLEVVYCMDQNGSQLTVNQFNTCLIAVQYPKSESELTRVE